MLIDMMSITLYCLLVVSLLFVPCSDMILLCSMLLLCSGILRCSPLYARVFDKSVFLITFSDVFHSSLDSKLYLFPVVLKSLMHC